METIDPTAPAAVHDVTRPSAGARAAPPAVTPARRGPLRLLMRSADAASGVGSSGGPAACAAPFDAPIHPRALSAHDVAGLASATSDLDRPGAYIDLILDRVAADGPIAQAQADLFPPMRQELALDPRHLFNPSVAEAALHDADAALRLGRFWGAALAAASLSGVRLRGLSAVPAGLKRPLLEGLRETAAGKLLILDTAGLDWGEIGSFAGIGLDAVTCSLAWWNWHDGWFFDELAMLRPVAPVIAALPAELRPEEARRALGLAVSLELGWIVPETLVAAAPDLTRLAAAADAAARLGAPHLLSSPGETVTAILRGTRDDPRCSHDATLLLLNTRTDRSASFDPSSVLPNVGGAFSVFAPSADMPPGTAQEPAHAKLVPGRPLLLAPGALLVFQASRLHDGTPLPLDADAARRAGSWARLALEAPSPAVDGGLFPVKRIAGELVDVEIDVIGDGHDKLAAALQWRGPGDVAWHEARMRLLGNDRWSGSFPLERRGLHLYRVEAWRDVWATFRHELGAKHNAGVPTGLEIIEGIAHVRAAADRGDVAASGLLKRLDAADEAQQRILLLSDEAARIMAEADDRPFSTVSDEIPVDAERTGAGFASWYEVFPRSMSDDMSRHGTFADVERHLPRVKAMGFDVLYFPPIHPIGKINRKGPNNTLTPGPEDVGSPYAVGSPDGGHDALHPELGTLAEFLHLREAAEAQGLELALDFAIQCSPDHPWLKEHKDWFDWRPDGTIRYAENPPKKYQDIVNVDFYAGGSVPDLWLGLANVVLFWCEQGIRLFRVDNPHTKPFPFWQWMIAEVRARYPDSVFLAEAFTRPKVMARLAKVGFSQSYTYFTWRNSKAELTEYLTQLTTEAPKDFFRPHFFVNTPDINPFFLQNTGRGAFLIRAAAAATLSGLWGVYNGFELCEGTPLAPGKEEYLDSEKFQLRAWDWQRPGNIVAEITRLNRVRAENPALHSHRGIAFLPAYNDTVLFFEKATRDRGNVVLVAISMDPNNTQSARIELPLYKWGLPDQASLAFEDLLGGERFSLAGKYHDITLTPDRPYLIWRAVPPG